MKAMLLAAGRGERMQSLTDDIPKPLVRAGNKTLIEYNLESLQRAGITEVVINVSYRSDQVMGYLGDGKRFGLDIIYSDEPGQPLGTGGGIFKALPHFDDNPFLVLSCDVWTNYPLQNLFNKLSDDDAYLVLVNNPDFHVQGDYFLSKTGQLSTIGMPKLTYASFSVIHPRLFEGCQSGYFSLSPLFEKAMKRSAVSGERYAGSWFNVGTVNELKRLEKQLETSLTKD